VRVGADKNPSGFDRFVGVGLDANLDGALDLFLAVDNSGNPDRVGIFDAAAGGFAPIPEPVTGALVGLGLLSLATAHRRRRR
jgi:hypothetical protein